MLIPLRKAQKVQGHEITPKKLFGSIDRRERSVLTLVPKRDSILKAIDSMSPRAVILLYDSFATIALSKRTNALNTWMKN
jgi:hypothetical protein